MVDAWARATKRNRSNEYASVICDRCDQNHPTDQCPYFRKEREDHPDALIRTHNVDQETPNASQIINATLIRQPGDGSCLFHALSYGLGTNADHLRMEIAYFIGSNPEFKVAGSALKDWIFWDTEEDVSTYVKKMAWKRAWGGGIEMAACSHLSNVAIDVYERSGAQYRLISCFGRENPRARLSICYIGRNHYDALDLQRKYGSYFS